MKRGYRSFLILFVVALFLASLALNWLLYNRAIHYYRQLNETRLDPLGLSVYPSSTNQTSLTDPDKVTVVFFGDSRLAEWSPPPDLSGFEFVNRGIGAQTSTQVLQRFDYHVKPLRPQIIVIQVCINDLKTIPLFPERKRTIITNCQENIRQIVARSLDLDATVILTTLFPIGEVPLDRRFFWSDEVNQAIGEINSFIFSLEGENVIVLDTYPILASGENGVIQDGYAKDFLHVNAAGYKALNNGLTEVLVGLEVSSQ